MIINRAIGGSGGETASIFVTGLTSSDTITCTKPSGGSASGSWVTKASASGWEFASLDEYGSYSLASGGDTETVLVDAAEEFEIEWEAA